MLTRLDPPEHGALRHLVSRSFTPKRVAGLEPRIRELCREMLPDVPGAGGSPDALEGAAPTPRVETGLKMADHFDPAEFEPKQLPGRITAGSHQPTPYAPTEDRKSEPLNRLVKKRVFRGSLYFVFVLAFKFSFIFVF